MKRGDNTLGHFMQAFIPRLAGSELSCAALVWPLGWRAAQPVFLEKVDGLAFAFAFSGAF